VKHTSVDCKGRRSGSPCEYFSNTGRYLWLGTKKEEKGGGKRKGPRCGEGGRSRDGSPLGSVFMLCRISLSRIRRRPFNKLIRIVTAYPLRNFVRRGEGKGERKEKGKGVRQGRGGEEIVYPFLNLPIPCWSRGKRGEKRGGGKKGDAPRKEKRATAAPNGKICCSHFSGGRDGCE